MHLCYFLCWVANPFPESLLKALPAIIGEASKRPLGIVALAVICVTAFGYGYLHFSKRYGKPTEKRAKPKMPALISLVGAALAFGGSLVTTGSEMRHSGRVLDRQTVQPIAGVKVTVAGGSGNRIIYTDSEGTYAFLVTKPSELEAMSMDKDGYSHYDRYLMGDPALIPAEVRLEKLPPPVKKRHLAARVLDLRTNHPVEGVKVTLEADGAPLVAYTDSEGSFSFDVAETSGLRSIVFDRDGYQQLYRVLQNESDLFPGTLRLTPNRGRTATQSPAVSGPTPIHARHYAGTVYDAVTGQPLEGVKVTLYSPSARFTYSDSEGAFTFEISKPSDLDRLRVEKEGYRTFSRDLSGDPTLIPRQIHLQPM
jgi:5-hydroxyisourate hydrolase-like protein (transthyretin family)